jgi:hypothetical protein
MISFMNEKVTYGKLLLSLLLLSGCLDRIQLTFDASLEAGFTDVASFAGLDLTANKEVTVVDAPLVGLDSDVLSNSGGIGGIILVGGSVGTGGMDGLGGNIGTGGVNRLGGTIGTDGAVINTGGITGTGGTAIAKVVAQDPAAKKT